MVQCFYQPQVKEENFLRGTLAIIGLRHITMMTVCGHGTQYLRTNMFSLMMMVLDIFVMQVIPSVLSMMPNNSAKTD